MINTTGTALGTTGELESATTDADILATDTHLEAIDFNTITFSDLIPQNLVQEALSRISKIYVKELMPLLLQPINKFINKIPENFYKAFTSEVEMEINEENISLIVNFFLLLLSADKSTYTNNGMEISISKIQDVLSISFDNQYTINFENIQNYIYLISTLLQILKNQSEKSKLLEALMFLEEYPVINGDREIRLFIDSKVDFIKEQFASFHIQQFPRGDKLAIEAYATSMYVPKLIEIFNAIRKSTRSLKGDVLKPSESTQRKYIETLSNLLSNLQQLQENY